MFFVFVRHCTYMQSLLPNDFSRYFPLSVFYFVRASTIFSRLPWLCFARVSRFCFPHQFVFSCLHVFLLLFQVFAPFPSPLTYSWLMNSFCSAFLSFPRLPSPILLVLSLLLRRLFHSPLCSFPCLFSFSQPRGLIFYSLPFSPMLWFSRSGHSFLLTLIIFGNSSSPTCFFFSCCLLLLLLFFPPVFFVPFSSHSVFLVLLFSLVFCYFIPNLFFSHSRFPHHLLSCFAVVFYFLPVSSPRGFLLQSSSLLMLFSVSLRLTVSLSLSSSSVLRLRLFAFLSFSIVFSSFSHSLLLKLPFLFFPILYDVLLPSSPHILLFPPSLIMIFSHSSALILFFSQPSLLSYSYSPTHLSFLQALLALLSFLAVSVFALVSILIVFDGSFAFCVHLSCILYALLMKFICTF